ncbi:hypothetical protein [Duganella sp.]|uniref:hypothetical protein n=1 Tax=Duganella sp. TaxID=1904440 RepID=UPI0031CEEACC
MSFQSRDIMHKGMRRFWQYGGSDKRGISISWGKQLNGQKHRYSIEVDANWRVTFDCAEPDTGIITAIDLEDLHRPGGAHRH